VIQTAEMLAALSLPTDLKLLVKDRDKNWNSCSTRSAKPRPARVPGLDSVAGVAPQVSDDGGGEAGPVGAVARPQSGIRVRRGDPG
jgi:hypothetical protein